MRRNQDFSQELDEFDILFMNSTVTQEYEALASRLRESNPKTLQDLLQDQKVKSCVAQGRSLGKYENLVDTIKRSEQGAKEYYLAIKNVQKIKEIMPEIEAGIMQYVEKGWEEETRKEAPNRDVLQQIGKFWEEIRKILGEGAQIQCGQEIKEWIEYDQKMGVLFQRAESINEIYKPKKNKGNWKEKEVAAFEEELEKEGGREYDAMQTALAGKRKEKREGNTIYQMSFYTNVSAKINGMRKQIEERRGELEEEREYSKNIKLLTDRIRQYRAEIQERVASIDSRREEIKRRKKYGVNDITKIRRTMEYLDISYYLISFPIKRDALKKQKEEYTIAYQQLRDAGRMLMTDVQSRLEIALEQIERKRSIKEIDTENAKAIYTCMKEIGIRFDCSTSGAAEECVRRIEQKYEEQELRECERTTKRDGVQYGRSLGRRKTRVYQEVNVSSEQNPINKTIIRMRTMETIDDKEHPAWFARQLDAIQEIPVRYERQHQLLLEGAQTNPETSMAFYCETGIPQPLSRTELRYKKELERIVKVYAQKHKQTHGG